MGNWMIPKGQYSQLRNLIMKLLLAIFFSNDIAADQRE